jgi:predicted ATP-grasp superfamily ATP-dependent carboligase
VAPQWVLVTDGGDGQARSTLAAVRALGLAGYSPVVTVSGPSSLAAASRYCARRVPVPPVTDPGYAAAVRTEQAAHHYLATLAASDGALLALEAPVRHLVDKTQLMESARLVGLAVPPTRVFQTAAELLGAHDLEFPVVLKPAISTYPARLIGSREDLAGIEHRVGPFVLQAYLGQGLRAAAGVVWEGRLVAAVHQRYLRTWPNECGTACAAETVEPDLELERRLLRLLEGYQGIFQAQLAGDCLLDLNPRVYGSLPLAVKGGANLAAVYCDVVAGRRPELVRARSGVFYRWLEGDIRHMARAVRTGRMTLGSALRAMRPHLHAAHSTEWARDPRPMVARFRHVIARRER